MPKLRAAALRSFLFLSWHLSLSANLEARKQGGHEWWDRDGLLPTPALLNPCWCQVRASCGLCPFHWMTLPRTSPVSCQPLVLASKTGPCIHQSSTLALLVPVSAEGQLSPTAHSLASASDTIPALPPPFSAPNTPLLRTWARAGMQRCSMLWQRTGMVQSPLQLHPHAPVPLPAVATRAAWGCAGAAG